jgi:hypothetical protein
MTLPRFSSSRPVSGTDPDQAESAPLVNEAIGPLMYFPMVYGQAEEASAFAATLAWAHGLVCYDPQLDQLRTPAMDHAEIDQLLRDAQTIQGIAKIRRQLECPLRDAVAICNQRAQVIGDADPSQPGMPSFVLITPRGRTINNPAPEALHQALTQPAANRWFAMLERNDGWYLQVGIGTQAATRPGWYALERQNGNPGAHYRAVVTDLREVVAAFAGFASDDPHWSRRFAWQPYQI